MRRAVAVVDVVAVLVFVAIGRTVHARGGGVVGLASTAWPFLVGLGIGWLAVTARHRDGAAVVDGVVVVAATVAVGMTLRVVTGPGTAVAFIAVAVVFLGTVMTGGRLAVAGLGRWRPDRRPPA
jgi:hypothetical protein